MLIRPPTPAEAPALGRMWFESWSKSHAHLVPPELARARTLERFQSRAVGMLERARVAGPVGAPVGFCVIREDELDQLFVAHAAHGTGTGAALLADGEARLAAAGVRDAWLACAIGNDRAARFYEKHGWRRMGTFIYHAESPDGTFPLETWRYEKTLASAGTGPIAE